jgi:hypothetical protein
MTTRNTNLKPLILVLFLCSNVPFASAEVHVHYSLDTEAGPKVCRYRPEIEGVSMGWFNGTNIVGNGYHACYTKNHGDIGEKYDFNNKLIGSGHSSNSGMIEYSPPMRMPKI